MKEIVVSNGLYPIITQALEEMKSEQGDSFRLEEVNLSELERRTGISRAKLRRLKKDGFKSVNRSKKKRKSILDGYTSIIDNLLSRGIRNSSVCFECLKRQGYPGGITIVKDYIFAHKHLLPPKRQQVAPQGNRGRRFSTEPGEAYQMDWGFVNVVTDYGPTIKCACFAMICHHCGQCYIEFFPNAKQENLFIGMLHAFRYMGVDKAFLHKNVMIAATSDTVTIYSMKGEKIVCWKRASRKGEWLTDPTHLPASYKQMSEWNAPYFTRKAMTVGPYTVKVIEHVLKSREHEVQTYRLCMGILNFTKKYSKLALEDCCKTAVETNHISYSFIKNSIAAVADEIGTAGFNTKVNEERNKGAFIMNPHAGDIERLLSKSSMLAGKEAGNNEKE